MATDSLGTGFTAPQPHTPRDSARPRRRRSYVRRVLMRALQVLALLLVISILATLALRWIPPPATAVMMERRVDAWWNGRPYHVDYQWVRWDRISPQAALAVIAAEDQNFATHHGFDFESIQKALDAHERGRRLRGASTISQQVAKNVFLWSGRSLVRKGLEAYFTVLIELTWSKRRILEVYLNIIELGDGVFGVEAAGRRYFRKPAAQLGAEETALLAAVLPNPVLLKANQPSAYVEERRAWILQQMELLGGTAFLKRF
jgi:monofunctional biosynthetic peptidoglycan transglycosylase